MVLSVHTDALPGFSAEQEREALVAKVDAAVREVADRRRQAAQRKQSEADRASCMAERKPQPRRDPRRGR